MEFRWRARSIAILLICWPALAGADAIVVTRAMFASTIAELYVEEDRLLLELEIGPDDLEAFRNILPDEPYRALGHGANPLAERLETFFGHDLVIRADDGPALVGRILEIAPRQRIRRDEISGAPLPPAGDAEPEHAIFARIEYPMTRRPRRLTLFGPRGPAPASVGFVVYHRGIALNDFRFLSPVQALTLDWTDPWYSAFDGRSLRRSYYAPMSGFLYVEPYEVRKEIVLRPMDLQHWVDLGLDGRETIPVELQPELKRRVAEFLREHQPVRIDGRAIEPELARVNFLERTLRSSRVIEPPEELEIHGAILGVIFVYPIDGLPERAVMDWDLWNDRIEEIPAVSVDQAGPLPVVLTPDWPQLEWINFLTDPELPTLTVLRVPPGALRTQAWRLRWLVGGVALVAVVAWARGRRKRGRVVALGLALAAAALCFGWGAGARLSEERSREIVGGLLHNVYRAFDFREEERIYDVLEQSVAGDLLARIYLETRRGLEVANQGGARARVKEIEIVELQATPGPGDGFTAMARWNVGGSVGHWGHVHQRRNQYRAALEIASEEGRWKLVGLDVLDEERI